MSAFTHSKLASRRDVRRERFEAKHHPEAVFEMPEEQALASDLAFNEMKPTEGFYDHRDHFALEQQNGRLA
ncbi:hypothetical protein J2W28_001038 [Variovorax boronicumulans]|uniref:hypothetical protein n=1 Tax=Variovorax boronicumulans TaxID=436515 RepID=UPI002783B934|nr:hypothetical protein [Variovorax boronicumulans]MDP9992010.1 hypothetical protein [Variovorax boronicumulans]MDQ0001905.1 hypothetical protein [Variovorax boronicumulans]